jgi:hypothetical protein
MKVLCKIMALTPNVHTSSATLKPKTNSVEASAVMAATIKRTKGFMINADMFARFNQIRIF